MLAHIDGLTQLANRRHFDNFFEQEWSRCLRLKQPISIAMIDLDHFKLLNDNFGHLVGDICLKSLANLLTQFARRPSDLCARYGGEEFVLVLGNTHAEQAYQLLSRFMTQLTELHIEELHNQQLTVSIGLATLVPGFLDNATTLIDMADKALYQAKETGRNKLVVAQTQTDIVS
nr:GGDEF domain-containing protein [Pseudoalteromonas sp. Ps84H-4]